MRLLDISVQIEDGMVVYPNNPEVQIEEISTGHSTVSKVVFGTHTATHVDAPKHVFKEGQGVDRIDINKFFGPCRVLNLESVVGAIRAEDLEKEKVQKGERILVKTKNSTRGYGEFFEDYIYLDGKAAEYLANKEITLFGIDYLSVKQKGSEDNTPHTALLEKNIPIFEGLDLLKVTPGSYIFVGFPLKFKGLDGAPARVVLINGLL